MRHLLLLLLLLPLVGAFTYEVGEFRQVQFYCVNASDGNLLGSSASLKVYNESGIFYEVVSLPNIASGVFVHNITNLSRGHCYSFYLNCSSAGNFESEWGTVCTESNMTSASVSNLASVGGLVFGSGFLIYLSFYFLSFPVLAFGLAVMAQIFLCAALYLGLKWAEFAGAASSVLSVLNFVFYLFVVLLGLSIVAFFWYSVVYSMKNLFVAKGLKGKVLK